MSECSRCKKTYSECDLRWVEVHSENSMQIIWTGRGRAPDEKRKMEVVCEDCLKKN